MYFSKRPVNRTKLIAPLNIPNIKPKTLLSLLYDEILPSNKNSNKLVNSLKITRDIANIIPMEKNIIMVVLMDTYFEINKDKST